MLRLELIENEKTTKEFLVKELPAILGRLGRAVVRIEDPSVSREHARIFAGGGRIFIADLNSSNGTFVNDKRITRAAVKPGDRIRLGRVNLLLAAAVTEEAERAEEARKPERPRKPESPRKPEKTREPERPGKSGGGGLPRTAETGDSGAIRLRKRILQYNRIPARGKGGILRGDFFQIHPSLRLAAILLFLLLAIGIFFLARWLARQTLPAPWESDAPPVKNSGNK